MDLTTIAILGGTGNLGSALAARLARPRVRVILGSRDADRARAVANNLNGLLGTVAVEGKLNTDAVREAEYVVIAVPYEGHATILKELAGRLTGKVVIDAVVPLKKGLPFVPAAGSVLLEAQELLGPDVAVVGALHNISALDLQDANAALGDVLVCGDNEDAKLKVMTMVEKIGARSFDAGPAATAYVIEGLTGVLVQLNRRYKSKHAGVKIFGID
jgi:hypothetical protein